MLQQSKRDPALDGITRALKGVYDKVLREPVPRDMQAMLDELDRKTGGKQ